MLRDPMPGERGWRDYGGKVPEMQPWPEAQARADEILSAWDAWHEARGATDHAHGVHAAEARCSELAGEIHVIWDRMASMPAHTAEGLRVKLRSLRFMIRHTSIGPAPAAVLRSLLKDAGVHKSEIETEA